MNINKLKPLFTDEYLSIIKLSFDDIFKCLNQIYESSEIKNYINILFDFDKVFENSNFVFDSKSTEFKLYQEIKLDNIISQYDIKDKESFTFVSIIQLINNILSYIDSIISQRIILDKAFGDKFMSTPNSKSETINNDLNIYYNDEHKIVLNYKKRYISLICLFMWIYSSRNDSDILRFIEFVKTMKSNKDGDDNKSNERTSSLFDLFHKFIHLSKKYSAEDVEFKFNVTQTYLLLKSLYIIISCDNTKINNTFIDRDIIYDECEFDCMIVKSGSDTVWSNVILSSIYLFKSKYDYFDLNKYNEFIKCYSNVIINLGSIFKSRNNYKYLYSLGILLSVKFLNISNTNEFNGEHVIKSNVVNEEMFSESNDAFCMAVKRNIKSKNIMKRNIVVEKQVDSYLIYDIFSKNLFNIRDVYYSLDELNDNLKGKNNEDVIGIIKGGLRQTHNISLFISYLIMITMFIVVIVLIIKNYNIKNDHDVNNDNNLII